MSDQERWSEHRVSDFCNEYGAQIEVIRSTLPWWVVRSTKSDDGKRTFGMPFKILSESESGRFALMWTINVGDIGSEDNLTLKLPADAPDDVQKAGDASSDAEVPAHDIPDVNGAALSGTWVGFVTVQETGGIVLESFAKSNESGIPWHLLPENVRWLGRDVEWDPVGQELKKSPDDPPESSSLGSSDSEHLLPDQSLPGLNDKILAMAAGTVSDAEVDARISGVVGDLHLEGEKKALASATTRWNSRRTDRREIAVRQRNNAERHRFERRIINFAFPTSSDRDSNVEFNALPMNFYPGYSRYKIIDRRGGRSRAGFLVMRDDPRADAMEPICCLDGTAAPIHAFNRELEHRGLLNINRETAVDYLIHFCRFVHAERGAFSIVEKEDDFRWLTVLDESSRETRQKVLDRIGPVKLVENPTDDIEIRCVAFLCYGRNLFLSLFQISQGGMVAMVGDAPVIEDLPVIPAAFDFDSDFVLRERTSVL